MINLINYALLAEQKKYGYFNKINEAYSATENQTAENLNLVLSGKTDDNYIEQWNQLMASITKAKEANKNQSYTVMITDNNGNDMVLLNYTCTDNKVKPSDVYVASAGDAAYWIAERDKNKATTSINSAGSSALEKKALAVSTAIKNLFIPGSLFFSTYVHDYDDDDGPAADAFQKWYTNYHQSTVDSIRADADKFTDTLAKTINIGNADAIDAAVASIIKKMKDNFEWNNIVKWRIDGANGLVAGAFEVDTDFS